MITEWIDWLALITNGLWVISLSVLIAIAGFRLYLGITTHRMMLLVWTFGALMCMGFGLSLGMPLQKLVFAFVGVVCVYQVIAHLRTGK